MDYAALKAKMIKEQLELRGISSKRVLRAFAKVDRHTFVSDAFTPTAYSDFPLPIGEGQTISQPYMVAIMTQCLDLNGNEKVLEIGTGSGYQTALIAELAKEVYTVERFSSLSNKAKNTLDSLGYRNIFFKTGDGTLGWQENAPYDRIIITAASPEIPGPLIGQLSGAGMIVAPLGAKFSQILTTVTKDNDKLKHKEICGCVFVPLIGEFGHKQ